MKKILYTLLSASLALTACTDFDDETSKVFPENTSSATISISSIADDSFEYTVSAPSNSVAYAYAVFEGVDAESITEDDILASDTEIFVATSDASSSTDSYSASFNSVYVIAAVSYDSNNKVSPVATATVTTTDSVDPEFSDISADGTTIIVTFTESVQVSSSASFSAMVYYEVSDYTAEAEVTIDEDLTVGTQVAFIVEGAKPGANVSVGWTEGSIVDYSGNSVAAIEVGFTDENIYQLIPTSNIDLVIKSVEATAGTTSVSGYYDLESLVVTVTTTTDLYPSTGALTFTLESSSVSSTIKSTATYVDANTFTFTLPKGALAGQTFSVVAEEGAFTDDCKNPSNEVTLVSDWNIATYDYSVDDIVGTYTASYDDVVETWTITATGNTSEDGEIELSISGVYESSGYVSDATALVAYFNPVSGILTLGYGPLGTYSYTAEDFYIVDYDSWGNYELELTEAGEISSSNTLYIYTSTYYFVYTDSITLSRVE